LHRAYDRVRSNFSQHLVNVVRCAAVVEKIAELAGSLYLKVAYEFQGDDRSLSKTL
jgi:hypothetical protein